MINVIIVEDQQLILRALCNKVLQADKNVNIIATAINGKEAYEKIKELKPDIVFTDISMPLMSGLEMIKKIKEDNLNTKFVIISGYKDFDYAREAIKYGVDEYLLKPIVIDDIKIVLENLNKKISMNKSDYENHMINKLINSTVVNQPTVNINFNFKNYYVMLLNAGPYSNFNIDYITPFYEFFNDIDLVKLSREYIKDDEKVFLINGKANNEILCVFATNSSNVTSLKRFSNDIINISNRKNIYITIGISRPIKHIENIGIKSQIVRTIVKKHIIFSKSLILDCSKIDVNLYNYRFFLNDSIEKRLKIFLQNNQRDSFINECNKIIDTLEKNNATQMEIEKCFKTIINKCSIDYLIKNSSSDVELKIDKCISSSKNYSDLSHGLNIIFNELIIEYLNVHSKNNDLDTIVKSSKEYIENHISEDINVSDIATIFSVSPTYFSRIFKKKEGISPIVYITNIRIDTACKILKENDFTVKEVSELCGYSDQFYFSKTFKSITGMPPSEYKLKYFKN